MNAIYDYIRIASNQERGLILLELLVIGVLVYWALSFLEGTRGERLFRGVIFIILFASLILKFVIDKLQLERLDRLYDGVAIGVVAVIAIAFQPEIRRALTRIGQAGFLFSSPQQLSRSVEEIIKAVTQMAAIKTGAIIVIEQQVGLGEFIDAGVKIDSKVSADLLKTIFYSGTPLHDMAVVIQGDRIVAARVQLPLAENSSSVPGQLGSRHRAAIGVTTSSDAIVIVVSEETGIISIAMNGNLIRNISEEQLRRYLTTAVVETTPIVERIHQAEEKQEKKEKKELPKDQKPLKNQ